MKISQAFLFGVGFALIGAAVYIQHFAPKGEVVPPQSVRVGLTFDMPCEEHGTDKVTIDKTEIIRFYHLVGGTGEEMNIDQDQLLRGLKELGVLPQ